MEMTGCFWKCHNESRGWRLDIGSGPRERSRTCGSRNSGGGSKQIGWLLVFPQISRGRESPIVGKVRFVKQRCVCGGMCHLDLGDRIHAHYLAIDPR